MIYKFGKKKEAINNQDFEAFKKFLTDEFGKICNCKFSISLLNLLWKSVSFNMYGMTNFENAFRYCYTEKNVHNKNYHIEFPKFVEKYNEHKKKITMIGFADSMSYLLTMNF